MKAVIFTGLMSFVLVVASAQTASVPSVILDSMIWEVKRGRQCSLVIEALQQENKALGIELRATTDALNLSQKESATLQNLVQNAKAGNEILTLQFDKDRKELRRKIRKRNLIILGETIGIVLVLIL